MASGIIDATVRPQIAKYWVEWSDTPIANTNKSILRCKVYYWSHSTEQGSTSTKVWLYINGTPFYSTFNINGYNKTTLVIDQSVTIEHNPDGYKTATIRLLGDVNITYSGVRYTQRDTGTHTINLSKTLPAPSIITNVENMTIGKPAKFNIQSYAGGITHRLTFTVGTYSQRISEATTATGTITYTITPTEALFKQMTSRSAVGYVQVDSYLSGNYIGTKKANVNVYIDANDRPQWQGEVNHLIIEPSPEGEITNRFLLNRSKADIYIRGIKLASGASLKHYKITINDTIFYTTEEKFTTPVLRQSGINNIEVIAVDSRGMASEPLIKTFTVETYKLPSIRTFQVVRGEKYNNETTINYLMIGEVDPEFPQDFTIELFYKERNKNTDWKLADTKHIDTRDLSEKETISLATTPDMRFSLTTSYEFSLKITDSIKENKAECNFVIMRDEITTEDILFDICQNGVAIGKVNESNSEKTFECEYKAIFYGGVEFRGGISGSGTGGLSDLSSLQASVAQLEIKSKTQSEFEQLIAQSDWSYSP